MASINILQGELSDPDFQIPIWIFADKITAIKQIGDCAVVHTSDGHAWQLKQSPHQVLETLRAMVTKTI